MKLISDIELSNIDKHSVDGESPVLLCNYLDVYRNDRIVNTMDFMKATASEEQIRRLSLQRHDVIITKDSEDPTDIGIPSLVEDELKGVVCGYHLALIRSGEKLHGPFLNNAILSNQSKAYFRTEAVGMTRYALGKTSISDTPIPLPPSEEQRAIASFLDREICKIDILIREQKELITLLQEKRQALISNTVTKGMNPKAKMKDSGVEWLGEVPLHWELKRLRRLCQITTGDKDTENRIHDGKYPFFVRSQEVERIDSYTFDGEGILTAGDGVGVAKVFHYYEGKLDFHQRVYLLYNFKAEIKGLFLFEYIRENFQKEVLKLSAKSTVDSLRMPMFQDFPVLVPPVKEQKTILEYLNKEIGKIDDLIREAEETINLMHEHRASLISEAVTGKIDVRHLA